MCCSMIYKVYKSLCAMPACVTSNRKFNIEVPLLLYFFAIIFSDPIRSNLIIFRTCYVSLGYNKSECALLGSGHPDNETAKLEEIVEPYADTLNVVNSVTQSVCSAIICFFVGPWSDRFGRKLVLLVPVIGYSLYYLLLATFATWETLSPWYSLICSIPVYLTGGASTYFTVLLCYVSDDTEDVNRGVRMGLFEAFLSLGIFLGNVSSSFVFLPSNYVRVFLISFICLVVNFLFTSLLIPESVENPEREGRLKGLFQITNVKEMLLATFQRRRNYDRFIVLGSILMLTVYILVITGDGALSFLFVREKFHWSLQQYTLFSAAHNIAWVVGALIGTYLLHKLFKISEPVMVLLGFSSMCFGMLAMGLAQYDWEVYAASFSRGLGAVISPMVRSLISKIVPKEEIGKIFALLVVSESFLGMAGSPLFTTIYNATISTNPAIFNFVGAGFYVAEILLAIGIIFARRLGSSEVSYEEIQNAYDAGEYRDEAED